MLPGEGMNTRRNRLRELAEFPFTKIQPPDFRVQIASARPSLFTRVFVETTNPSQLAMLPLVHVVRDLSHLGFVVCELPLRQVTDLARLESVGSVWKDDVRFHYPNPRPIPLGTGPAR
jgi:hypothetical protein